MLKGGSKKHLVDNNSFWHNSFTKIVVKHYGFGRTDYFFKNNKNNVILRMTFDPLKWPPEERYYLKNHRDENHYITEEMYYKFVNKINLKRNEGLVEDQD